jgi:hypothetical protein
MAEIRLINKIQINIDYEFLNKIIGLSELPSGKILLLLYDNALGFNNLGITIPKSIVEYEWCPDFFINFLEYDWSCAIAISEKVCKMYHDYKAYFTYLLGHELGHAKICLLDEELHIHACLVRNYIRCASKNKIKYLFQMPEEIICDKLGVFIAENIFSREMFTKELHKLKEKMHKDYELQIENLLNLSSQKKIDKNILRKQIIDLSLPFKKELIEYWRIDTKDEGNRLAKLVRNQDFDSLFEY